MNIPRIASIVCLSLCLSPLGHAADFASTEAKLRTAMKSDVRTPEEVLRDAERKPIETLSFFGLRDDMKVVELMPGGGWFTKLLAPTLAERGQLIIALGTDGVATNLLNKPGFEKVKVAATQSKMYRPEGSSLYNLELPKSDVENADLVVTFRNYHNFGVDGRRAVNKFAHDSLKKGGLYGVLDHTRRHMEPDGPENGRRVDPVLCIKEVQEAGFVLVDYSRLHFHPDDELRYEVGRKSVTGNTDRFALIFRKL